MLRGKRNREQIPNEIKERMLLVQQMATLNNAITWESAPRTSRNKNNTSKNYALYSDIIDDAKTAQKLKKQLETNCHISAQCLESQSQPGKFRIAVNLKDIAFTRDHLLVRQFAERNQSICDALNRYDTAHESDPTWINAFAKGDTLLPIIHTMTSGYYQSFSVESDDETEHPDENKLLREKFVNAVLYLAEINKTPNDALPHVKEQALRLFDSLDIERHKFSTYHKFDASNLPKLEALAHPAKIPFIAATLVGLLREKNIPKDVARKIATYGILHNADAKNIIKAKKLADKANNKTKNKEPQPLPDDSQLNKNRKT